MAHKRYASILVTLALNASACAAQDSVQVAALDGPVTSVAVDTLMNAYKAFAAVDQPQAFLQAFGDESWGPNQKNVTRVAGLGAVFIDGRMLRISKDGIELDAAFASLGRMSRNRAAYWQSIHFDPSRQVSRAEFRQGLAVIDKVSRVDLADKASSPRFTVQEELAVQSVALVAAALLAGAKTTAAPNSAALAETGGLAQAGRMAGEMVACTNPAGCAAVVAAKVITGAADVTTGTLRQANARNNGDNNITNTGRAGAIQSGDHQTQTQGAVNMGMAGASQPAPGPAAPAATTPLTCPAADWARNRCNNNVRNSGYAGVIGNGDSLRQGGT